MNGTRVSLVVASLSLWLEGRIRVPGLAGAVIKPTYSQFLSPQLVLYIAGIPPVLLGIEVDK